MTVLKDSDKAALLRALHAELWERLQHCEEHEAEALLRNSLDRAAGYRPAASCRTALREYVASRGFMFSVLAGVVAVPLLVYLFVWAALLVE